jgi:hypothetical protein
LRFTTLIILIAGICPAQFVPPPDGLKGNVYFISPQHNLPDFGRLESVGVVYTNPLFVLPSEAFPGIPNRADWFAIDYTGNIYIREPGKYRFRLVSDDGSKLYIDDNAAIDLDHGLGDWAGEKTVDLSGGIHRIRLSYFQGPLKHHCIALMLSVTPPGAKNFQPFDTRNFNPPTRPEEWKFGSPHDFDEPPDSNAGRVKLRDVVSANHGASAAAIVSMVRSGVSRHTSDQAVAKSLDKLIPGERIDSVTVDQLESEGAGPETVAALQRQQAVSARMPPAAGVPVTTFPPHPSPENEKEFLSQLRLNALRYTASLPDFICTQLVRRYVRSMPVPTSSMVSTPHAATPSWKPRDVLTVNLSYFANNEKYDLVLVDGHKATQDYEAAGGAIFRGDFGSSLLEIFSPASQTEFKWDHWTHLRNQLTQVYSYRTTREHSHYKITVGPTPDHRQETVAGRHGFIYADSETHMVFRITGETESVPQGFPVIAQSAVLDYQMADVSGRQFLLPLRAEQSMSTAQATYRNIVEFRNYRKFTGDSKISFDHQ